MSVPAKIIRWSYLALFTVTPLFFLSFTSELFEFNKLILVYILTTIIICAWAVRCILEKKIIFKRTLLDWPILIFLISQFLSLLFSIDRHTSLLGYYSRFNGGLLSLVSYSLLYWAYVSNLNRKTTVKLVSWSTFTAAIIAIYGVLEHFGFSISCLYTTGEIGVDCWVQDVATRVFATLGQPNWLATYLVALIFIPISYLSPFRSPSPKLGEGLGLFILLFLALLYTQSRSGLLAFGISSVVFWGLVIWKLGFENLKNYLYLGIWLLVITTLVVATKNPLSEQFLRRPPPTASPGKIAGPALEVGGSQSTEIRKIVWTGAINIWRDGTKNFWLGSGPETFAMAYYQHRPVEHNQTSEWELLYNKAHNEFLNFLATTGTLGLGSYLLLLIFMCISFIKSQSPNPKIQTISKNRNSKSENLFLGDWLLVIALLSGWLSLSIANFWGFSTVVPQLFLFLFPALAITLNHD